MTAQPSFHDTIDELAALGMRLARAVTRLAEIETEVAEVLAANLPERGRTPTTAEESRDFGLAVDDGEAALASAVPRMAELARAFDRVSRAVRRTVALGKRLDAGWPVRAAADTRAAMVRRQVGQRVAEAIRNSATGEAAERLFDDLAERLDDPALDAAIETLPVDAIVARIRREMGLAEGLVHDMDAVDRADPKSG